MYGLLFCAFMANSDEKHSVWHETCVVISSTIVYLKVSWPKEVSLKSNLGISSSENKAADSTNYHNIA